MAAPPSMNNGARKLMVEKNYQAPSKKLQTPTSKLQRNPKLQTPNCREHVLEFGTWCFSGAWMLVFGASYRPPPHRSPNRLFAAHPFADKIKQRSLKRLIRWQSNIGHSQWLARNAQTRAMRLESLQVFLPRGHRINEKRSPGLQI